MSNFYVPLYEIYHCLFVEIEFLLYFEIGVSVYEFRGEGGGITRYKIWAIKVYVILTTQSNLLHHSNIQNYPKPGHILHHLSMTAVVLHGMLDIVDFVHAQEPQPQF